MNKLLALAEGAMVVSHQQQLLSELRYNKRESQIDLKKDHLHTLSYLGLPYQDHNYGAPPPPTPPQSPPHITTVEPIVAVVDRPPEEPLEKPFDDPPLDESIKEPETSDDDREEEGDDDESNQDEGITRCICDFEHDDGYMICCDKCLVWQHVECMGLDRSNIPDNYFCEKCEPRLVDVATAKILQGKKKKHLEALQRREELDETSDSQRTKKKVKKKKRRREKKKKKKERERGDSTTSNGSDDIHRSEGNESDSPQLDDSNSSKELSLIQCTPDLEELMDECRKNPEMFLAGAATYHGSPEEMKRTKVCIGQVSKGEVNGVVTLEEIPANQPIMQLSGTLSLLDEKRKNRPLESFMFMYSSFCNTELVLNAGSHDNKARFTRKSCSPNAEIRHMIVDGEIQLYTFALKDISSDTEVTLGIDFDFTLGPLPVKCACGKKSCPVKKFWHKHKSNGIKQKNNNGEVKPSGPVKKTVSPLRLNLNKQTSQETPKKDAETKLPESSKSEPVTPRGKTTTSMEETPETKPLHKMTREERKMDAIMKAFERLEKSQQRRQQTLERLAKEKPSAVKKSESSDQSKQTGKGKEPEKVAFEDQEVEEPEKEKTEEEAEKKEEQKEEEQEEKEENDEEEEKDEERKEENITEQEKVQPPPVNPKPKPRVQRRRRRTTGGSRRRSRNSSGASSTVSIEVSAADDDPTPVSQASCPSVTSEAALKPSATTTVTTPATTVTSPVVISSSATLLSVQTSNLTETKKDTPLASPAANSKHFKFPKTKRFFMNEWLNEKAQEASADSPLTVKTEISEIPTTINSPNAAAIRDRTTSLDSSLGSAKKRWLRQAMQETSQPGSNGSNSPICNGGGSSPATPSPAVSPNSNSSDFMTPLKKRLLRHSLSEERPSPKVEPPSVEDSSSVDQSLITIKEEKTMGQSEESLAKNSSFYLHLPAKKEVRKNSSMDSGLSVTTPADLEAMPSFPIISSGSGEAGAKQEETAENNGEEKSIKVTEQPVTQEKPEIHDVTAPTMGNGPTSAPVSTIEPEPTSDAVKTTDPVPTSSPVPVLSSGPTPGPISSPEPSATIDCAQAAATTPNAALSGHIVSKSLKRCLSDEVSFMNGEINPAYFSPKKRHLYLRQNIEPGAPPLGASWPRQETDKPTPNVNEGSLSHSWSGSSGNVSSHPPGHKAVSLGHPPGITSPSAGLGPSGNPGFVPPAQGEMIPPGVCAPTQPGFESRVLTPGPPEGMISPRYPGHVEGGRPAEEYLISPKPAASLSAPTTPSKKRVSLLEYRKRKSVSATKKPPEKPEPVTEECKETESPREVKVDGSPTTSSSTSTSTTTADSTPEKGTTKPANIITFKDKKFPSVAITGTESENSPSGLQSLPLFSKAPIAETEEGKKLTLTDEAHKLITSLTQVLMEGKTAEKQKPIGMADMTPHEDPLQRMRRELNEKNKEKVMALKRAHSPEPPPPPPEKKMRPEPVNSPPVPPPPPPRQAPPFGQAIHSPKGGGLAIAGNHVVVNTPGFPVVQQVVPQTNGGHMVYPPVMTSNPPAAAAYPQQPIAANHSPRGSQQQQQPPVTAKHSPRGSQQPVTGKHSPRGHYSPVAAYNNHVVVEEHVIPIQGPVYQNFNNSGDQRYHVNGGGGRKVSPTSYTNSSKYPASSVHDKRSSSYGRNSLSPRRYQRH